MTQVGGGARAFAALEDFATSSGGAWLALAWAFVEAIAFPVVPDVALCLLALAAPRRAPLLLAAVIAGSLLGTTVLYLLTVAAPDLVATMLTAIPGVNHATIGAAQQLVVGGNPLSIAQLGPGTPLKVYTFAWATGPGTPAALAVGVVLNRFTRIGPGLLLAWAVGRLAPGALRRHPTLALGGYAAFWIVAYALYLG